MILDAISLAATIAGPSDRRLLVLVYHRVLPETDAMFPRIVTAQRFRWQMELVRRFASPVPLRDGIDKLSAGRLPARAVAVTFDDGYADNAEVAAPILMEFGIPATFFVATGFLDGGRMWNDTVIEAVRRLEVGPFSFPEIGVEPLKVGDLMSRGSLCHRLLSLLKHRPLPERLRLAQSLAEKCHQPLPSDMMMTSGQVRGLADQGFDIGGHTVNHPILSLLSPTDAAWEIEEGRRRLEGITDRRVELFAYPNGRPGEDYGPIHVDAVQRLGFAAALSTRNGVCSSGSDRWQLPRVTPWGLSPARFLARLLFAYRYAAVP